MREKMRFLSAVMTVLAIAPRFLFADDDDDDRKPQPAVVAPSTTTSPTEAGTSSRYFLGLLDHRSLYGGDFFHDPIIGPELDSERQLELDYTHGENHGSQDDEVDAGFEWNVVGQLSVAGEIGWDWEHQASAEGGDDGQDDSPGRANGFENVDLAAYHPIFQFVSSDNLIDYTAVIRLDVDIPTRTAVSGNDAQLTPYLGHLLRIGDHVSLEAWTGPQITIAPRQTNQLIYGASLGYELPHQQLPLPLTDKLTPIFELDGQTPFSSNGQDALFGVAGFEIDFHSADDPQPQLEIGYQFPMDEGARNQLRWGIITELILDF